MDITPYIYLKKMTILLVTGLSSIEVMGSKTEDTRHFVRLVYNFDKEVNLENLEWHHLEVPPASELGKCWTLANMGDKMEFRKCGNHLYLVSRDETYETKVGTTFGHAHILTVNKIKLVRKHLWMTLIDTGNCTSCPLPDTDKIPLTRKSEPRPLCEHVCE